MLTQTDIANFPDTKKRLVDAGVKMMRLKGYNATTVDDICETAGLTKGAFFHYFDSKEELGRAALARFGYGKSQEMQDAPFRLLNDPLERVYGRLDHILETVGGSERVTRGCLVGSFAQEISFTHPELRDQCDVMFRRMAANFEEDLAEAKDKYAPDAAFDPKKLALMLVSLVQGSNLLAKSSASNAVLADNLAQFRDYLRSIFKT